MICPKCKSRDVSPDMDIKLHGGMFANAFKCNNCGYSGQFFIEFDEEELKEMKK